MSRAIGLLMGLLLVVYGLTRWLSWLTRRTVHQTDLDLIGREATVTRSIRPHHIGRITCQDGEQSRVFSASGAQQMPVGTVVLITAFDQGVARTIPKGLSVQNATVNQNPAVVESQESHV